MKTIFKLPKINITTGFTSIINTALQDTSLSFAAKGLLCYLLSLPEDWDINVTHLMTQSPAKRKAILTLIEELIYFGYMRRETIREKSGRVMRVEYKAWETPLVITVPNYSEHYRASHIENPYFNQISQESPNS